METLRILTALEDLLGSLGPQINIILSRAITLENNKEGSGNVLLEDQDIAAILQMTKEKLSGQIIAGLLLLLLLKLQSLCCMMNRCYSCLTLSPQ